MVRVSGRLRREFLSVDDLAEACVFLMDRGHDGALLNVGCGEGATIAQLAQTVMRVLGVDGRMVFDATKPDGAPRKLLVCAV